MAIQSYPNVVQGRAGWSTGRGRVRIAVVFAIAVGLVLAACQSPPTTTALTRAAAGTAVAAGASAAGAAGAAAALAAPPPGGLVPSVANFGWTQGSFSVSDDGAAQYSLPIWAPAGRGKVAPQLALSYSSRGGNSSVGVGWSLDGLPSVARCPRNLSIDGGSDALRFDGPGPLCIGDQRLIAAGGSAEARQYRTEREAFARIVGYDAAADGVPDYFRIWAKEGQILTLGQTTDSRLTVYRLKEGHDRDSTTRVTLSWAVNKVEDRNGNASTVEYARDEGDADGSWWADLRPSVIRYDPNRRVAFGYEPRPDPIDGFAGGVHTRSAQRLKTILVFGGPVGGTAERLREYRLSYQDDSITGRSLLTEIKECDGEGVCKLPLPLSYSKGSKEFQSLNLTGITDIPADGRVIPLDVNGDGKDDLLYPNASNSWRLRMSTGSGFGAASAPPIGRLSATAQAQVKPVDYDLDGRMDVLAQVPDPLPVIPAGCNLEQDNDCEVNPNKVDWQLFRSTGTGFVASSEVLDPGASDVNVDVGAGVDPAFFADIDGNGTPDFITARYLRTTSTDDFIDGPWRYRLNDGTAAGKYFQVAVDTGTTLANAPARHNGTVIVDTDGDGRAELVGTNDDDPGRLFSLGLGPAGQVERAETDFLAGNGAATEQTFRTADVNGDGLVDNVVAGSPHNPGRIQAAISSGNGVRASAEKPFPYVEASFTHVVDFDGDGRHDILTFLPLTTDKGIQVFRWGDNGFTNTRVAPAPAKADSAGTTQPLDVDADGMVDIVYVRDGHLRLLKRTGGTPDQLIGIGHHGTTPRIEVTYTTLANGAVHSPCTGAYPVACPAAGGSVVATDRSATYTGDEGWDTSTHSYAGARIDLRGRGWLGFSRHTVTRALTGSRSTTEFDNQTRDPVLEVYPFAGLAKSTSGAVGTHRTTTVYNNVLRRLPVPGTYTVEQQSSTETVREESQTLREVLTQNTFDDYGNVKRSVQTTTGGRRVSKDVVYRNDTADWLIGLPTKNMTTACTTATSGNCTTRTSAFEYDAKGNPTRTVVEPDKAEFTLATATSYGQNGAITSISRSDTAGRARTQRFTYDADRLHPTATTNAAGHQTTFRTHSGLGVTLDVTDPNGVVATSRYDGFGRIREVSRADGSFTKTDHGSFYLQSITVTDSSGGRSSTVVDQLGRNMSTSARTFDGGTARTDTEYDALGRVSRTSRPHLSSETARYAMYSYDYLDRLTRVIAPGGSSTRHEYSGREIHTYDARGAHTYVVHTVDGDVARSFDPDPRHGQRLETSFTYGPFGETTKVFAADRTEQEMTYDLRGNRTRHEDPSAGVTTATYNAFGELATTTDATGATTANTYDALGRITKVVSPDGTATTTWDTAPNGIGQPASARSAGGVGMELQYDSLGRSTTTAWNVDGTKYEVALSYDDIGRVARTTYPAVPGVSDRFAVTNVYNDNGYLAQVKDATTGTAYWTVDTLNADGQLTKERYGNGVVASRTYQPTTGLLDTVSAVGPGNTGQFMRTNYRYDGNYNVTHRTDIAGKRSETYDYDALNRMTTWTYDGQEPGVAGNATFSYDATGNLLSEVLSPQGGPEQETTYRYGQDGAPRQALTSRNDVRYGYDAAGRQTSGPQRTISYNTAGLPKVVERATGQGDEKRTEYSYDPTGVRVVKQDEDQTVVTIGGLFEMRTSDSTGNPPAGQAGVRSTHRIVADGRVVAEVSRTQDRPGGPSTGTDVTYLHHDGQGSTVAVTNADGGVVEKLYYDPFGRRTDARFQPLPDTRRAGTRLGYTGHEYDDEHGLVNATGRIYEPVTRRFLTPDPFVVDRLWSQAYNRYSYVANNPATNTDPTGLIITGDGVQERGGGSRGSLGAGTTALGYPSGGSSGWTGPLNAPFNPHAPDMAASVQRVGMGSPSIDAAEAAAASEHLGEVVREWQEAKAKAEANPRHGDVHIPDDDVQGFTQIGETLFWTVGNQHWVWFAGDRSPTPVSKGRWGDVKYMVESTERYNADAVRDITIVVPIAMQASFEIQMFFVGGGADLAVDVFRYGRQGVSALRTGFSALKGLFARKSGPPTIPPVAIPHGSGLAAQGASAAEMAARTQVTNGSRLWRFGTTSKSAAGEGQYWSLEHPLNPGFGARYGVPPANIANANFIESAVLKPGSPFITRAAPGFGPNPGGGIEVVVPPGGVIMQGFSVVK